MTTTPWKYNFDKTVIYRTRDGVSESWSVNSEVYLQLVSEGYVFENPDAPMEAKPSLEERLEAAETLIALLLSEGES